MRKALRKFLALLLPVLLLLPAARIPARAGAKTPAALRIALISDPHVYPADMTNNFCDAFVQEAAHNGRAIESTQALFEAALGDVKALAAEEKLDCLFIPGDMSEWGEYAGHTLVARLLREFEAETGVPVAVIPGNHDLDNGDACDFSTGAKEKARYLEHDEFPEVYAELGYDLPRCERFGLSYAADLGDRYRLIAADTNRRRLGANERYSQAELRDWVLAQCAAAKAEGRVVIGMGHHPLGEMFGGMDTFMGDNFGFGDARMAAEAFADAGMHFYFSGHLHFNEIALRVSDSGEPLYDIMTAASGYFPGGYRIVEFSAAGEKIQADVRSVPVPLASPSPYPEDPYYDTFYGRCFGGPDGDGLVGWLRYAVEFALGPTLRGISLEAMVKDSGVDLAPLNALLGYLDERLFGQPEHLLGIINGLVEEIVAMPVSNLPCTRFIGEFRFGDPEKPGTFEDLGDSALIYLFGKRAGAAEDLFVQDALRRMRNGEFVDQLLNLAVPKILAALGGEALPLLLNNSAAIRALRQLAAGLDCPALFMPLLALVAGPAVRDALSASLYRFASGVVTGQSPTGSPDGLLVCDGPVAVPLDPGSYRLPQNVRVTPDGCRAAQITWYARPSASSPALRVTRDGSAATEVSVSVSSEAENVMAEQLDIGYAKLMGREQPALKHTARLTGLQPGATYSFTAGDSARGWWSEPQEFRAVREKPVLSFFLRVAEWFRGMMEIFRVWGVNAGMQRSSG